ncbi:hypothetical protein A5780_18055 [Nocardia sp. 852002-20019_SCH5090214]|uniref:hypothetical protein n=1 Tax=Nocardia TaxID=1817 RepID=UPI0007EADFC2|nr:MULTISPECIES: hypothetical protein [Nocardia]OBA54213.1 hypothetical protein A5789_01915 [Nocardia sp. 852002-51101_SCH5132738]OBA62832.1 hypothetical protein A5780_18055 [Nocardia sp. 852002-20019_SCH5090214]OBB44259.1 hypothetical protein A5748_27880 [Nocardia sp. 852002-51244_SCH5132740]OBF69475.1 hypothetical protein A9X06_04550 [Mycobacterium sp. 852002-51759_SCH5129042]
MTVRTESGREQAFGLRELLGLRGPTAWLFLVLLEGTITLYMVRNLDSTTALPAVTALIVMVVGGALVLVVPGDPLPWTVTIFVAAAGPVATALTSVAPGIPETRQMVWTTFATSYVLAVLVLRGRMGTAWLGVAGVAVVIGVDGARAWLNASAIVAAIVPIGTVIAISVFAQIMRPTQRSLRGLREEASAQAAAEATMAAADGERTRQLERLDRVARPILERIADGAVLTVGEREQCRLLEAELRDGLRAPQLMTEELSGAARGARARGVEVVLLDDGGFADAPKWLRERVIDVATRELDAANAGSVTVRILPPGRRVLSTVLAQAPDHDRRTEIGPTGTVTVMD